jgi:hypothetical protein
MLEDHILYHKAGYPVLLIRSHEPERFIGSAFQEADGRTLPPSPAFLFP